jgi:putative transposase
VGATYLVLSVMAVTLRTNANGAFRCGYQVVWCPKCRRTVIGGRMEVRLKEIIAEVMTEQGEVPPKPWRHQI